MVNLKACKSEESFVAAFNHTLSVKDKKLYISQHSYHYDNFIINKLPRREVMKHFQKILLSVKFTSDNNPKKTPKITTFLTINDIFVIALVVNFKHVGYTVY